MLERTAHDGVATQQPPALLARRLLFAALVGATIAGMVWLAVVALSPGGLSALDILVVVLFAVTLPWFVIGFWNATIGFLIMRFACDPVAAVTPAAALVHGEEPITASTAILMCVRNEPPERAVRYLSPLAEGLAADPAAGRFHLYVLSDSSEGAISAAEEAAFGAFTRRFEGRLAITYRRRQINTGFKAGNIADFCARWGAAHEFAITLDADSVMTPAAVLRLVRIMQAEPRLGILQSLVTGMPSTSAFARLFQFGMRLSMRSYTIGSAWWQADCGPYWGHNAAVRLKPFIAHCELPTLPDNALVGGHVLSHDQIEAVLMRRGGFEVSVLADEGASFEENPPTLLEFTRRDLRWCQGNMQYWHFVRLPGLRPVSRYQLAFAILMFLGSPAWVGLLVLGSLGVAMAGSGAAFVRPDAAFALLAIEFVLWYAPTIATALDVLVRPPLRAAFGGTSRFVVSTLANMVFFLVLAPIMWIAHTVFLVRLLMGRPLGWGAQARDDHAVPVMDALRVLWPQTLVGLACVILLALTVPAALPYALLLAGGPLISVPLAVITAAPAVGRALLRLGIGRLPEESEPPPELRALNLPALAVVARQRGD